MTNAISYEAKINAILTAPLPAQVEVDELGNTVPAAQYRAEQLSSLSQEIRRIAWAQEAKPQALAIAARADQIAADLVGGAVRPLPRFESFVSGGTVVPAIQ